MLRDALDVQRTRPSLRVHAFFAVASLIGFGVLVAESLIFDWK